MSSAATPSCQPRCTQTNVVLCSVSCTLRVHVHGLTGTRAHVALLSKMAHPCFETIQGLSFRHKEAYSSSDGENSRFISHGTWFTDAYSLYMFG